MSKKIHECNEYNEATRKGHPLWGDAIFFIEYGEFPVGDDSGECVAWVAHNDEYGTFINYCPFCGVLLGGGSDGQDDK